MKLVTETGFGPTTTLNHLARLANWLSFVVSTYLSGAFDYVLLSCHVFIYTQINDLQTYTQDTNIKYKTRKIDKLGLVNPKNHDKIYVHTNDLSQQAAW